MLDENVKSPKYINFSDGMYAIVDALLRNQNFLRYVYYTKPDIHPLSNKLRDVSPQRVLKDNFNFHFIKDNLQDDKEVVLFLNHVGTNHFKRTLSVERYILSIAIADEHRLITTGDKPLELRAYSIAREIAKSIDHKSLFGVGDIEIVQDKAGSLTRQFDVLDIFFEVKKSNVKGFGNATD